MYGLYTGMGPTEQYTVANITVGDLTAIDFAVLAVDKTSGQLDSNLTSATGQLGRASKYVYNATFPETLYARGNIAVSTLGIYLSPNANDSEILFGDTSESTWRNDSKSVFLQHQTLTQAPNGSALSLDDAGRDAAYSVLLDSVTVKNLSLPINVPMLLETGASFAALPYEVALEVNSLLFDNVSFTEGILRAPCDSVIGDRTVSLTFGGVEWRVRPEDLLITGTGGQAGDGLRTVGLQPAPSGRSSDHDGSDVPSQCLRSV